MRNKSFLLVLCLIASVSGFSCNAAKSKNEIRENSSYADVTPTPQNDAEPLPEDASALCDKLHEIKKMAYEYDEPSGDPVYDALLKQGKKAVPCLIDKITDTTKMRDPGAGPARSENYRVGDAAVFMLLMITGEEWQPETMFPPEYAKRWKNDGIYTYFAYVDKPENRKKIQLWWRNWLKEHPIN